MPVRLYLVVFSVGVSTLGAEIAAARLLAPFFGASTIVWANTIATVLVALSIGYWLGGTVADRRPTIEALCRWVLVGACLVALVPLVAQPFLTVSVEAFDNIEVGAAVGSLVGVLALVAVPVLVLGAVAPWAIRLRVASVEDAGRTAGRLYALSTIGSLLGTFAAALLLIPLLGTQRTFIFFALLLAASAATALPLRFALVPLGIAAMLALPPGVTKGLADGGRVLGERETEYQYARVVELAGRRAPARAQRGPGVPLRLPSRQRAHRQRVGRLPLASVRRSGRAAALAGDPRQRRGNDRSRLRALLPRDRDRRRRDRSRADRARPPVVRAARSPRAAAHPRRRAAVPAPHGPPLRRDLRRRLPAAVHPLLPHHRGVLRPGPRPAEPRRHGDRQRRSPRGLAGPGEGAHGRRALGVPARGGVGHHGALHALDRGRARARARARARPRAPRPSCASCSRPTPPACALRSPAARPTPTTARPWSG